VSTWARSLKQVENTRRHGWTRSFSDILANSHVEDIPGRNVEQRLGLELMLVRRIVTCCVWTVNVIATSVTKSTPNTVAV
jgi:hypothetical protein